MRVSRAFAIGALVIWTLAVLLTSAFPWPYLYSERGLLTILKTELADFDTLPGRTRVMLLGSSPVRLGLSAGTIEAQLGLPTRNLALLASRRIFTEYLALAMSHLRRGDVVVLDEPNLISPIDASYPMECADHVSVRCVHWNFGAVPHAVDAARTIFASRPSQEFVGKLAPNGDYVFAGDQPEANMPRTPFMGHFASDAITTLSALMGEFAERGVCPIFVFSPFLIHASEMPLWQREFADFWRRAEAAGVGKRTLVVSPLWVDPKLFLLEEHLNTAGRELWTNSVIAEIRKRRLTDCSQPQFTRQ